MVIEYLTHNKNYTCKEDLSMEKIEQWYFGFDNSTNENIEYLSIEWSSSHLTKFGLPSVGIHPPLQNIINKNEVINWLKMNHSEKQVKQNKT
jgi:hypothetical protein